jgi:hypothetical protein
MMVDLSLYGKYDIKAQKAPAGWFGSELGNELRKKPSACTARDPPLTAVSNQNR